MTYEPKVSIVIPVYAAEKYLNQCVESVVNQTYRNLEIILVDDESPDSCPEMCDMWAGKDDRIRVIHKKNAGAGYARNSGLQIATGKYICFFDSDDYLAPDAIHKALSLAKKEQTDIVIFGAVTVDRDGNCISKMVPEAKQSCYRGEEIRNVFLPDLIDRKNDHVEIKNLILSFWVCMFSMELIRRNNWEIVSEREYLSEDSYSLISLYQDVKRVAILPEPIYFYREIEGSLSHTYKENFYQKIRKFYLDCIGLSVRLEYTEKIRTRIAGLFFALSIGAMKQIASCDLGMIGQIREIRKVVRDDTMQHALVKLTGCYRARARRILLWAMRKQWYLLVYLFVKVQTAHGR